MLCPGRFILVEFVYEGQILSPVFIFPQGWLIPLDPLHASDTSLKAVDDNENGVVAMVVYSVVWPSSLLKATKGHHHPLSRRHLARSATFLARKTQML